MLHDDGQTQYGLSGWTGIVYRAGFSQVCYSGITACGALPFHHRNMWGLWNSGLQIYLQGHSLAANSLVTPCHKWEYVGLSKLPFRVSKTNTPHYTHMHTHTHAHTRGQYICHANPLVTLWYVPHPCSWEARLYIDSRIVEYGVPGKPLWQLLVDWPPTGAWHLLAATCCHYQLYSAQTGQRLPWVTPSCTWPGALLITATMD